MVSPPPTAASSRQRILAFVDQNPGAAKVELCQALDLGWGTVNHHVLRLQEDGRLVARRHKGRLALFLPGVPASAQRCHAALRDDRARRVLDALRDGHEAGLPELMERTELSRRVLARHLRALEEVGLVRKRGLHRPVYHARSRALEPDAEAPLATVPR